MLAVQILLCLIVGALASHHGHVHKSSAGSQSSSSESASSHASSSSHVKPKPTCRGCPQIKAQNIDFSRMVGAWYEVKRSKNNFNDSDRCPKLVWSTSKNCSDEASLTYKSRSNIKPITSTTVSTVRKNNQGTGFTYRFTSLGDIFKEHLILKTDYISYALVWSCEMHGKEPAQFSWIFSRQPNLPCNIDAIQEEVYASYNLTVQPMVEFDQSDCCEAYASYDFCH